MKDKEDKLIALLKKRNQELLLLLETNRTLTRKLDLEELLAEIMHQATKVVKAESSSLVLVDQETNELVFDITMGEKGGKVKQMRLKLGEGIAGWVAKEGKPLIVEDVSKDERFNSNIDDTTEYKTKSILCVPLMIKDSIIGVMEAINKKGKNPFSRFDLDIFSDFAAQAAVAIDNAKLFGSLEQEKKKIEAMFSGMGDGAVFTDSNFRILIVNKAACNLLNLDGDSVVGKSFGELSADFDFIDLDKIKDDKVKSMLFDMTRKEGKKLYVSCRLTRIIDQEGKTMGYIMILRDITNEKTELMMTRDFFSLISHKLKTPLVAITGYTPMLLKEAEFGQLNEFQKTAIRAIDEQGRHLQGLIEKLLKFTSLGAGKINLNPEKAGLNDLIDSGIKEMQRLVSMDKVKIIRDEFTRGNIGLNVDRLKAQGVIRSIIENAIKFNDKEEKRIDISAERDGDDFIKVSIKDNGIGIPSEECENVFRRFYQVEEYFTGQVEGAGLGLSFARDIVDVHGGRIEVKSKIGKGSTFIFTLPVYKGK